MFILALITIVIILIYFNFQGIKDFYDRLSEPETEMFLYATKKFSGQFEIITKQEQVEEEEEEDN